MELNSIAFIPDGNRRYAKLHNLNLLKAYSLGTEKAWDVIKWIAKYPQIKIGTFYTLSTKNLERTKTELDILFKIFEKELNKLDENDFLEKNGIKLKFIGRLEMLPAKIKNKMKILEQKTNNNTKKIINLAIGYDGQAEIIDAVKKIAIEAKKNKIDLSKLDEKEFQKHLYSQEVTPDLIIRTSGTKRLSGFLTWQSSYSELKFIEKNWPEFSEKDLQEAINEFDERNRKYGK